VISGTAEAESTVEVISDVDGLLGTVAAPGGNWTLTPAVGLTEGPHALTARATDLAGNTGADSAPVTVTVDTTPPAAPEITSPADGAATNDATPDISGTAEADSTVEVISDVDGLLGTTTATGGNWTLVLVTDLSEGVHALTATATDAVGNASVVATLTVTVDTVAPDTMAAPTDDGDYTVGVMLTFYWNAGTDNAGGSGVAGYLVSVWRERGGAWDADIAVDQDVGNVLDCTVTDTTGTEQTGDVYKATVLAYDAAGNSGAASPESDGIELNSEPPGQVAKPSVTPTGPWTDQTTITFSWLAPATTLPITGYEVHVWGAGVAEDWVSLGAVLTYDYTLGASGQTVQAEVRAQNAAGWGLPSDSTDAVSIDTVAPDTPPSISADSQSGGQVECSWGASTDALSGLASYVLQVSTAPDFSFDVFFNQDVGNVTTHTVDASMRDSQTVYARVAAVDVAGNQGAFRSLAVGVRVDATAPWVSWSTPSASGVGLAQTVVVQFSEMMDTASVEAAFSLTPAPAGYVFQWDAGDDQLTVIPDEPPAGLGNEDVLLDSTTYSFVVASTATDLVGNALQAMGPRTFTTRDATPPALVSVTVGAADALVTPVAEADVEEMDTIVFTFDEDMDTNSAYVEIEGPGQEIWAERQGAMFDGDGADIAWTDVRTLTLTLHTNLRAGCEYDVDVWMISDASWNWPDDIEFMLQVAQNPSVDTVPPSVISTFPSDGHVGAGRLSLVAAFLSEPVAKDSLSGITVWGTDVTEADFEIELNQGDLGQSVIVLEPGQCLPADTLITVTLPAAIKDLAGNALGAAFAFSFTTGSATDTGAPTVSMTQPADGSTDAAQVWSLQITFEDAATQRPDPLDASTVTAADFRVFNDTDGVLMRGWMVEYESWSSEVQLNPPSGSVGLERGKSYTVTVGPGISDRSGNPMAASESFTFTLAAFAANAAPYVWDLEFEDTYASTSPFVRQLGYRLEIMDEYMGTVTATIVDSRGPGTGVDITEVVTIDEDHGGGQGSGWLDGGGGGPPSQQTPGMDDANYPTSGYYGFDITLDDGAGGVSAYTKTAWVWAPADVPNLVSVDGVNVDPVSAVNVASNVPTLAWGNVDSTNADVLALYLLDAGEMNSGPSTGLNVMLSPDVTSFDVPPDLGLPAGVYLWAVTQSKMGTGFGLRTGEGWSLDLGAFQAGDATALFTVGPDNAALDSDEFAVAQIRVDVDSDTGDFVGASDYAGTYAFASPNAVTMSYVDIAGNPGGGTELYACDDPELVITRGGPTSPGRGWVGRMGNLILQVQASDWFAPYLTVGARRFATAGFDVNSLDGDWCFVNFSISTTGGAFDRAGASMGRLVCSGGTATVTVTYHEDGPASDPSFDTPYTVDADGLVHLTVDDGAAELSGDVTFTDTSTAVSGTDTLFVAEVSAGDYIRRDGDSAWYKVAAVVSDDTITLDSAYSGTTATGPASVHKDILSGTISITQDSASVTGTDTQFVAQVSAGDYVCLPAIGKWYEVDSVTDDTNLTLAETYKEADASGQEALVSPDYRTVRGYIGGDALGTEILAVAADNDAEEPWFLLMAKNYDLQVSDTLTGQYRMVIFIVREIDGSFEHSGRGWGTIELAAGGTYTGTVCVGDSSRGGGGQEFDVSGAYVIDADTDEIALTGMGGESRLRVGPDLDTMFGFNIDLAGDSGADIVILSR
jgi:hypothetical protein